MESDYISSNELGFIFKILPSEKNLDHNEVEDILPTIGDIDVKNCDPNRNPVKEELVTDEDEGDSSPEDFETKESLSTTSCVKDEYSKYEIQDDQVVVKKEVKEEPIDSDDPDNSKVILDDFLNNELKPLHHEVDISDYEADDNHQENEIYWTSNQESETTFEMVNRSDHVNEMEVTLRSKQFLTGSNKKIKIYSCDNCKMEFKSKTYLRQHIRVHTGEKPYCCLICKKTFATNGSLTLHIRLHTGEKPFSCVVCKKAFIQKSHLTEHIRLHTGERPYSCKICKHTFLRKGHLTLHIRVHTGEKPYSCKICKKTYSQKIELTRHIRVHTGEKPYSCQICKKTFVTNAILTSHIRVHTGEKSYLCDICKKGFSRKFSLKRHILVHSGDKPYSCEICKKAFSLKSYLTEHIRVHTGEKPYSCKICKKAFSQKFHLTRHVRVHHRT